MFGCFFWIARVSSRKLRIVLKNILDEIESSETEIFPKQDALDGHNAYGNFINSPLFGKLIPEGKTVFLNSNDLTPYEDQWEFLESIKKNTAQEIDDIIEVNNLDKTREDMNHKQTVTRTINSRYGLPICIRKILNRGVTFHQRVACFRLAVNLKKIGIPKGETIVMLLHWRMKNKPSQGKKIIMESEVKNQVEWAYKNNYNSIGCEEGVINQHCDKKCPVKRKLKSKSYQKMSPDS